MVIGLFLSSCTGGQITKSDLQGTWVPDKSSQHWIKAEDDRSRCHIALRADGTFNGTVPDYLMDTFDRCAGRVMVGKGTWLLSTGWLETNVKLDFTEVDGQRIGWGAELIRVEGKGDGLGLSFWVGKPGTDRFVFERRKEKQ